MRHAVVTAAIWLPFLLGAGLVGGNRLEAQTTGLPTLLSGDCTVNAAGVAACTKTGGTAFAPSATTDTTNAANIASGTISGARLPVASPTQAGVFKTLQPVYNSLVIMDSWGAGTGSTQQSNALGTQLGMSTLNYGRRLNKSTAAKTTAWLVASEYQFFTGSLSQGGYIAMNGGSNDSQQDSCSTASVTTNCVLQYAMEANAGIARTIPWSQRMMPSRGTAGTTWPQFGTVTIGMPASGGSSANNTAQGTVTNTSTAGNDLTMVLPTGTAATIVGYTWPAVLASTASFSMTLDGSALTDTACTNTTTFSVGGCNGVALLNSYTLDREQWAVTSAATHTLVIHPISGTVVSGIADWAGPTIPANANILTWLNTNAYYVPTACPSCLTAYSFYNAALATEMAKFQTAGWPVRVVDQTNSITYNGVTYPALVPADLSITVTLGNSVEAATQAGHPSSPSGVNKLMNLHVATLGLANLNILQPGIGGYPLVPTSQTPLPTISLVSQTALGTGPSVSASGSSTDAAGVVSITPGAGATTVASTAGTPALAFTLTFSTPGASATGLPAAAPIVCSITGAQNGNAQTMVGNGGFYTGAATSTGVPVYGPTTALTVSTLYQIQYACSFSAQL